MSNTQTNMIKNVEMCNDTRNTIVHNSSYYVETNFLVAQAFNANRQGRYGNAWTYEPRVIIMHLDKKNKKTNAHDASRV